MRAEGSPGAGSPHRPSRTADSAADTSAPDRPPHSYPRNRRRHPVAQAAGFGFRSLLNGFRETFLGRDGREGLACRLPDEAAAVLDARAAALRLGLPRRLNASTPTRQTVLLLLNSTSDLVETHSPGPRPKVIPSQEESVSRVCGCRIVRPDQAKGIRSQEESLWHCQGSACVLVVARLAFRVLLLLLGGRQHLPDDREVRLVRHLHIPHTHAQHCYVGSAQRRTAVLPSDQSNTTRDTCTGTQQPRLIASKTI